MRKQLDPRLLFALWGLIAALLLSACAAPGDGQNEVPAEVTTAKLEADRVTGEVPLIVNFIATAKPGGSDLSYSWNFGTAPASLGSKSRPHVYTEPGNYTASVTIAGSQGSAKDQVSIEVLESSRPDDINNEPPEVTLSAAVPDPATPRTVSFLAAATDVNKDELNYVIDFGDGTRSLTAAAQHTYTAPGFYLATVVVTDGRDGIATAEAEVTLK